MMGGKAIPFVRQGSEDYWVTFYGSHDATDHAFVREEKIGGKRKTVYGTTLLVRHERRGKSSWGIVCNGRQNVSGKAANKLQGIIDTREGDLLLMTVRHLRMFPKDFPLIPTITPAIGRSFVAAFEMGNWTRFAANTPLHLRCFA